MLSPSDRDALADRLLRARLGGAAVEVDELRPHAIDESDAYAIQAAVCARAGSVGAWKTGRKSPDAIPIMAPVLAPAVRRSPAAFPAAELRVIGIELEIAFRVDAALPPIDHADFEALAAQRVTPLAAIEVVDSRIADFEAAGPLWKLADNQINGGLVVGESADDWRAMDLAEADATLKVDGRTIFSRRAAVPGGSAFRTFCAFARRVGGHCGGLAPGQVVTTGSITGLDFVQPGAEVVGRIAGLGHVRVSFPAG